MQKLKVLHVFVVVLLFVAGLRAEEKSISKRDECSRSRLVDAYEAGWIQEAIATGADRVTLQGRPVFKKFCKYSDSGLASMFSPSMEAYEYEFEDDVEARLINLPKSRSEMPNQEMLAGVPDPCWTTPWSCMDTNVACASLNCQARTIGKPGAANREYRASVHLGGAIYWTFFGVQCRPIGDPEYPSLIMAVCESWVDVSFTWYKTDGTQTSLYLKNAFWYPGDTWTQTIPANGTIYLGYYKYKGIYFKGTNPEGPILKSACMTSFLDNTICCNPKYSYPVTLEILP